MAMRAAILFALAISMLVCLARLADANGRRYVQENVLVSENLPALAIAVDDSFSYVGGHPVRIRDVAAGERFIFVDADHNRAERLLIVQFEGFLPGIDNEYRYDLSQSPVVAGYPFRSNGYAFNMPAAIAANPDDEAAGTARFLVERGYMFPDDWMMWRSLTVAGETRRDEVIIFYIEGADSKGLALDDLYRDDAETAAWRNIQQELEAKANLAYQLAPLNEHAHPEDDAWASIPNRFVP